jgi:hypothetical protein
VDFSSRSGTYLEISDTQGQRHIPLTQRQHILGDEAVCDIRLYSCAPLTYQTTLVWHVWTYRTLDVDLNLPGRQTIGVDLRDGDRIIFADDVVAVYRDSIASANTGRLLRSPSSPPPLALGKTRPYAIAH